MKVKTIINIISVSFIVIAISFIVLTMSNRNERNATETQAIFKQLGLDLSNASDFLTNQARQYVQYGEKKYYDAYMKEVNFTKTREKVVAELEKYGAPSNELALAQQAAQLSNTLAQLESKAFEAVERGDFETARNLMFGPEYETGKTPIVEVMTEFQTTMANRISKTAESSKSQANVLLIVFSVLFVSLAALIIVSLLSIAKKMHLISQLVECASKIADGHINVNIDTESKDEVGILAQAFRDMITAIQHQVEIVEYLADGDFTVNVIPRSNRDSMGIALQKMLISLNDMFGQIINSSLRVSDESKQMLDGSKNLAKGCVEAAQLSGNIKNNANEGDMHMKNMMKAIKEINNASDSIKKSITLLDDIASQTNILALNASVEAARVGEAGKGFAVVAEEVRNLSATSVSASNNIRDLIANSIEKTNLGLNIANKTSSSLQVIVDGINQNSTIISQIEQLSAESARVSETMATQSSSMQNIVAKFKVKQ